MDPAAQDPGENGSVLQSGEQRPDDRQAYVLDDEGGEQVRALQPGIVVVGIESHGAPRPYGRVGGERESENGADRLARERHFA